MFLTELDCEEVRKEVTKLLKSIGVLKHRLKKADSKQVVKKENGVFKIRLEKIKQKKCRLEQFDSPIGIPAFLEETCAILREQIDTEGLFRKPALALRQKELKEYITSGGRLVSNPSYTVTDVANLLKQFFRELPEPCIPYSYHEALQKCLDIKGQQKDTIMLVVLLLPLEYMVTLAYLMQFLQEVALHSQNNRMDVNNLAIVWTPNLMPFKPGQVTEKVVLDKRMTIIRILIENAASIGIVPEYLYENLTNWQPSSSLSSHDELELSRNKEKKKKRRSGSLTRMLSGIKRMVGKSEPELDVTPEQMTTAMAHTPRILSTAKKRKASESNLPTFSAKKRKELLDSLPQRALLPDVCTTTYLTPRVLIAQPNYQGKGEEQKRRSKFYTSKTPDETERRKSGRSLSGTRLRLSHFGLGRKHKKKSSAMDDSGLERTSSLDTLDLTTSSEDYVRISRSEYEDIKNRVSKIESRISSEFENIVGVSMSDLELTPEGPRRSIRTVQTAYERTLESAEKFNSPTSDELAKKLNRELRIRGSSEKKAIRSPSARKIGTIRRRSRENAPVIKRNLSLNIPERFNQVQFYPANSLRRGKPNTVQNGLPDPVIMPHSNLKMHSNDFAQNLKSESFETQGFESNVFDFSSFGVLTRSQARRASSFHGCDLRKVSSSTPANAKHINSKSPLEASRLSGEVNWKTAENFLKEEKTEDKSVTGRPSVAKLRSQNAGMVLAKAKLFSTMVDPEQKTRIKAFKTNEVNDGKSREIKKRNSSKTSKDQKAKDVRCLGKNLSRENSLRKLTLETVTTSKRQLSKLNIEKENFPNSKVLLTQTSSSKTPQRTNRNVQSRVEVTRTPRDTSTVNSPFRERPRYNNTQISNLRSSTSKYGKLPVTPHHIKTKNTSSRVKTGFTPQKSPR